MGYRICPKCELNWIKDDEEVCSVCSNKTINSVSAIEKLPIKHKGCNVFLVYQGKGYKTELFEGLLWAPLKDKAGHTPSHWAMLDNVVKGDIIFHCVDQIIVAISVAKKGAFQSKIRDGVREGWQVDVDGFLLDKFIAVSLYRNEIISTCSKYKYQPFDKNGDGRQGYFFDLNDELAKIFANAIYEKNPDIIDKIPNFKELL